MARLGGPATLAVVLALAACAGPTPSVQPTVAPPTASPPSAAPTQIIVPATPTQPTPTPQTSIQPTEQPATATPAAISFAWRERSDVTGGPSAREDHTWTIDRDGAMAYLFGGRGPDGPSDELWEFNLVTDAWTLLRPSRDAPAARFGHTATWVSLVGLVVWSGQGASGFFDDIWSYDPGGNTWTQLASLGAVPAARYGSCASLGPDGELWISHGFTEDSGRFSDTRSYDFTTGVWTDRTPVDRVPVERCLHDCFWSANDQLILYGGQTTGVAALGDIWAYDLATGVWTRGADPDALARQLYALAPMADQALVFGGGSLEGGYLGDTWLIDPVTLGLTAVDGDGKPPARSGATLVFDSTRGRLLLVGGQNGDGYFGDVWELPFGVLH